MSHLYLCEKPSQAKDIARILANGNPQQMNGFWLCGNVKVTWCLGHMLEMAMPEDYNPDFKRWALDALPISPDSWKLSKKRGVAKQFSVIQTLLSSTAHVVIATDADREGEVIAREVLEYCHYNGEIRRLWLSALDDVSVRNALNALRGGAATEPLYYAGLGRARNDWLVGMNLTRAYTCIGREAGYDGVMSVGRVQTPTLALIVHRDQVIENFVPQEYYNVLVSLEHVDGGFNASWVPNIDDPASKCDDQGRCTSEQSALQVAQILAHKSALVDRYEVKEKSQNAPLPFSLSALQKVASSRWGYGAKQTLDIAQALYEKHKATTYPRSDCQYLPVEQFDAAATVQSALLKNLQNNGNGLLSLVDGMDLSLKSRAWNTVKVTAHHGIIPSLNDRVALGSMNEAERNVYDLVVRHYVAQFYPPCVSEETVVALHVDDIKLNAKGSRPLEQGWKRVISIKSKDGAPDLPIPTLSQGDNVQVMDAQVKPGKTKPPARFNEGTLIDAMANIARYVDDVQAKSVLKANEGIGTEATRAGIIETLKSRKYIKSKGKQIISTSTGRELVQMLPNELTDPVMTALMERLLAKIADGSMSLDDYMQRQEKYISALVDIAKSQAGNVNITPNKKPRATAVKTDKTCPECGKPLLKRKGKKGFFLGCSGYPDCTHTEFVK